MIEQAARTVVTGGTRGIGAAVVKRLARRSQAGLAGHEVVAALTDLPLGVDVALMVGWMVLVAQVAWKAWGRERAEQLALAGEPAAS